jgi:hypothetical protein
MTNFYWYILTYFKTVDKKILFFCTSFISILIFLNYKFGIETNFLNNLSKGLPRMVGYYIFYLFVFGIPITLVKIRRKENESTSVWFWVLVAVAPAIFALKVNFYIVRDWVSLSQNPPWGTYLGIIVNWPSRLLAMSIPLFFFWWLDYKQHSFWGLVSTQMPMKNYLYLLLLMTPLIVFASTRPDFLEVYPKITQISFLDQYGKNHWYLKLLFELSYGIDFLGIELFFRGFLILAFARHVGPSVILPMAVFYCSIHFGKPIFECLSSYVGGLILGVLAYRTQSILGGLVVHLGIAWMMELGGYLGHLWR